MAKGLILLFTMIIGGCVLYSLAGAVEGFNSNTMVAIENLNQQRNCKPGNEPNTKTVAKANKANYLTKTK